MDVRTVNKYIGAIFGKKEQKDPSTNKSLLTITECKIDHNDKVNNIFNIRDARNSLRRKTGKKTFSMDEIIKEIRKMKPSEGYRFIEPNSKR